MKRTPLKRGKPLARSRSVFDQSEAEKEARRRFHREVWEKGECVRSWELGHICHARDAHHCIRSQTLKHRFLHLPEDELLAILWDPRNGIPICRDLHNRITVANERLSAKDLERFPEVYAFAAELDITHLLERELDLGGLPDATD